MTAFRIFLSVVVTCLGVYTLGVVFKHGLNLLPIFFGDIQAMNWPGQFNFDFLTFLLLSGVWLSWRHKFSAGGIFLGIIALFGGMMFLAPYLLYASFQCRGDVRVLLLGTARARETGLR
jgi:hypothetical protein